MNKGNIELLFQYNDWANERILDTAVIMSLTSNCTVPRTTSAGAVCVARWSTSWMPSTVWRFLLKDRLVYVE